MSPDLSLRPPVVPRRIKYIFDIYKPTHGKLVPVVELNLPIDDGGTEVDPEAGGAFLPFS